MKYLYFAYGSNLDIGQMRKRCPGAETVSAAVLKNWRLVERCYADIEKADGECVHGALYSVTEDDLAALDFYEGYPALYTRETVSVTDRDGVERRALVYTMTALYKQRSRAEGYSEDYRAVCSAGARAWGIPDAFAEK